MLINIQIWNVFHFRLTMLTSILIVFCLFHCHLNQHVNASSIPHIEQDKRQLGIRMSLLYISLNVNLYKYFISRF
jgi:hypothetical protein